VETLAKAADMCKLRLTDAVQFFGLEAEFLRLNEARVANDHIK